MSLTAKHSVSLMLSLCISCGCRGICDNGAGERSAATQVIAESVAEFCAQVHSTRGVGEVRGLLFLPEGRDYLDVQQELVHKLNHPWYVIGTRPFGAGLDVWLVEDPVEIVQSSSLKGQWQVAQELWTARIPFYVSGSQGVSIMVPRMRAAEASAALKLDTVVSR